MNIAEYLISQIEKLGITDIFGLPGDYNFNISYAVQNNPNTRWLGCTNELNAGYAADGYAREKGFGAIITTYGVGELSAFNAIAGSYSENVPVINIVGVPQTKYIEEKTLIHHQFSNPQPYAFIDAYKNITEASAFLSRDNAKIEIERVLKIFVKERKPVYIAIPEDVATLNIEDKEIDYGWISDNKVLEEVTEKITEKIRNSEHPIILADSLVRRFGAVSELKNFAEKTNIPVTNFPMGMGIIDSGLKNYLGTYISEHGNPSAKKYLETTDCLIAVGTIYSDFNSLGFNLPYRIESQTAIYGTYTYVDGKRYDNVKMSDVLDALSKSIETKDYETEKSEYGYEHSEPEGQLTSDYIYSRLQEFYKEGDIVFAEAGLTSYGITNTKLPEKVTVHSQGLWCSIGWATGAAFGACIAKPEARIVLLTGEGAHQISVMEVGNMLKLGLKPIIVVVNNGGYSIERALSEKPENDLNNIVNINYSKLARAFEGDIWSTKVETADDFDKALRVTGIMNKLCYIEACTDALDLPSLTRKVLSNKVKNFGLKNSKKPEKKKEKKETKKELKLTPKKDMSFSTITHESLVIDDEV